MNVYDSARMADVLAPLGFVPVDDAEGADMVIKMISQTGA